MYLSAGPFLSQHNAYPGQDMSHSFLGQDSYNTLTKIGSYNAPWSILTSRMRSPIPISI